MKIQVVSRSLLFSALLAGCLMTGCTHTTSRHKQLASPVSSGGLPREIEAEYACPKGVPFDPKVEIIEETSAGCR
jgi:hypothetical protein